MNKYLLYTALLSLFTLSATAQFRINNRDDSPLRKLQYAEMCINNLYVDSVDEQKLVEDAIRGMLDKLDPHSSYSTPKEVKELNEPLNGTFEGIGVQFNMMQDTLMVIQPVTNGPSEKVGIIAGDRIVSVNDTAIAGVKMSKEEIMKRLRGPKGTKVNLGVIRSGIKDRLNFTVVRDKIPVRSVDATYMIRPGIGYIRIGNFGAQTHDEFVESLEKLRSEGMINLILDLQENGGGYLKAAVDIADEFLQQNDMIVYTEGRTVQRSEYRAHGGGRFTEGKVVVLVDGYTASAAEIVTGAIQDQDRGLVVGRRTFGKGLVQQQYALPDGSEIRLTVARYHTPSGRVVQSPYERGHRDEYYQEIQARYDRGESFSLDSISLPDSLKYQTLKLGRTVYGGGGILPDVFIPYDTTGINRYFMRAVSSGRLSEFSYEYADKHRSELAAEDFAAFEEKWKKLEAGIFAEMVEFFAERGLKAESEEELAECAPLLKIRLEALLARSALGSTAYWQVINRYDDPAFQEAMRIVKEWNGAFPALP